MSKNIFDETDIIVLALAGGFVYSLYLNDNEMSKMLATGLFAFLTGKKVGGA